MYPISPKVRWIVSAWIAPPGVERRSTDDPIAQGAVKCLLLGVREPAKGSVDCVHQFRRPLLNSQERRASRHPSAAATRPYGTAALRGAAATDPDTPARSAAGDRRPAAASQRLGITGAAFGFHEPLSPRRWIKPPQLPGTSHSSPDRAARWSLQVLLPRARRRDPTPLIHQQAGDRLAPAPSGSTARLEHAGIMSPRMKEIVDVR